MGLVNVKTGGGEMELLYIKLSIEASKINSKIKVSLTFLTSPIIKSCGGVWGWEGLKCICCVCVCVCFLLCV